MRVKNRVPIRRALAATLALLMMLSMTVTAFAAEPDGPDDGFYPGDDPGIEFDGDDGSGGGYAEGIETGLADVPVQTEDGTEAIPIETETTPATDDELLPAVTGFSDVPSTHGFYTAIMDCAAKGITSGYADGTFRPTNSVTRAQFCVMLSRAFYPQQIGWFPNTDGDGQPWFAPNVKVLNSNGLLKDTSFINNRLNTSVMNQAISRYDMAQLMTNIMAKKGFSATAAQKTEAQKKISDYKSIPSQHQNAVKNVYALGIITGYSNGTFGGNNIMNRGQGCVVIYRMTKYTPAATTTPDVDDSGKPTGNTGNTGNTGTGTDSTGNTGNTGSTGSSTTGTTTKNVTEAKALATIKDLLKKYPHGSTWNDNTKRPGTPSYASRTIGDRAFTSMYVACGGFASLVSDTIFGADMINPARKVPVEQVRPGDFVILFDAKGNAKHVAIAASRITGVDEYGDGKSPVLTIYDGNCSGKIRYDTYYRVPKTYSEYHGYYVEIWTRYPTNNTTPWKEPTNSGTTTGSTGTSTGNTNSGSTTTTPSTATKPTIQELMAAPCGLCGKTGGGSVINNAQTKKVCSSCANTNRDAMNAYFNS